MGEGERHLEMYSLINVGCNLKQIKKPARLIKSGRFLILGGTWEPGPRHVGGPSWPPSWESFLFGTEYLEFNCVHYVHNV